MMAYKLFRNFIIRLTSVALVSVTFIQAPSAAMIGTQQLIENNARSTQVARVKSKLAQEGIAQQLVAYGVSPADAATRVNNLSQQELATLEGTLDQQIAGSSAVGIIGAVFLVLIILELVGVTDVFKAF